MFDIRRSELFVVGMFSALFALIEGASALALAAGEAMFIAGVGVEGVPLAFVMLFAVMLFAIGTISFLQSKLSLERVLKCTLVFAAIIVAILSAIFSFSTTNDVNGVFLYALKLLGNVWVFASFSLYWNFADEYFSIRDGKRLYAIFSAFGCLGAVIGAGMVFVFSEYLKISTNVLLWLWLAAILAVYPIVSIIASHCSKLDTGVDFESEDSNFLQVIGGKICDMFKSVYVRAILIMYVAVIIASAINEYVALSAFSDYAKCKAEYLGIVDAQALQEASQLGLASLFGALGIGVNVFNLAVNLFLFNRLVSRFGVGNLALLQSVLFMVAFLWLINSFGIGAAVFSFFMYRGMLESVDANNENLMVSILPGALRQQVRLAIESFIAPFSTALAGVFLMIYAKGEDAFYLKVPYLDVIAKWFGFGTLSITGIAIVGFFIALAGLYFAFVSRREYPRILEKNLRLGWLDFSDNLEHIASLEQLDDDLEATCAAKSPNQILSYAEIAKYGYAEKTVKIILNNAEIFKGSDAFRASKILDFIFANKNFGAQATAVAWLLDASKPHPDFAVVSIARSGELQRELTLNSALIDDEETRQSLKIASSDTDFSCANESPDDLTFAQKLKLLQNISKSKNSEYEAVAVKFLDSENIRVSSAALNALEKCCTPKSANVAPQIAAMFKDANADDAIAILKIISKSGACDCLKILFGGVTSLPQQIRRTALKLLSEIGATAVPSLVYILKSDEYSYDVKSLAALSLNKIFPSQLKMLAPEIIENEFLNAYKFVLNEHSLESTGAEGGCLRRIYAWKRKAAVSFIIQLASISGRLPAYETLVSAIFSRVGKESANAIESLELGMSKREFELLQPLVDSSSLESKVIFAKTKLGIAEPSEEEVILKASKNSFEGEFLGACAYLSNRGDKLLEPVLCSKIASLHGGFLRGQLLEILDMIAVKKCSGKPYYEFSEYTYINKFSALNLCGYFDDFEPEAICALIPKVKILRAGMKRANGKSILIYSNSCGMKDAYWKICPSSENLEPCDFPVLEITENSLLEVAGQYPDAAMSIYLREANIL